LLALPPTVKSKSKAWKQLLPRSLKAAFGIIVPITTFFLSTALTPMWKSDAFYGWFDCLHLGKIVLAPLVFWAAAALYALEVWQVRRRTRSWIVLGLFLGSLVSIACVAHGLITLLKNIEIVIALGLLIPVYTAAWYSFRAVEVIREADMPLRSYLWAAAGSLPCWIGSIILAKQEYARLPETMPDCFVVSAALRGHQRFVGSFPAADRNGALLQVNRQLLTFRRFEALWMMVNPRTHRCFRKIYNKIGPLIAFRIRTAWTADMVFLLLKPAEWIAWLLLGLTKKQNHCPLPRTNRTAKSPSRK
jgi:hypothetical protein